SPISLAGHYLTDNRQVPNKWALPAITLQPRRFLVIFASGKDRFGPGNEWHTDFQLDKSEGSHLALTRENDEGKYLTISVFSLYPRQVEDVSFGVYGNDSPLSVGFFPNPSPGAANAPTAFGGFVEDTRFTINRGLYTNPFTTTISSTTPGATLIYTLDGTEPSSSNGRRVVAPDNLTAPSVDIEVTKTTTLRAMAIKSGFQSTNIDTHTYIFPENVLQQSNNSVPAHANWGHAGPDFAMDPEIVNHSNPEVRPVAEDFLRVPSISLVMDWNLMFGNGGIYISGEGVDKPTSIEFINPDGDTNDPNTKRGFQVDGTVRIVGGSSTGRWKSDKLSMRLKFSPDLRYELFGKERTDRFDTLILDHRLNNVWHYNRGSDQRGRAQYTHDQFPADLHNLMGGVSPEGRYCLLYINGILWGITELHERPDDNFAAEYLGGDNDDYDAMKHRTSTVIAGSNTNYNSMLALSRRNMSDQENYAAVTEILHIENFISYMITNYYVGNSDWAHQNWYATYNRNSADGKWYYHSWDPEHCMESTTYDATGKDNSGGPTEVFHNLIANPEFRLLFADRVHQHFHNDGVLTPQNAATAYMRRANAVDLLTRIESARWGDNARSNPYTRLDWLRTRDQMLGTASGGNHGSFFPRRTGIVLNQFRSRNWYPDLDPPEFAKHGGDVPAGFRLSIQSPDGGTIYYTTDGSDPRVAAQSGTVTEHILVAEKSARRAIMPGDSSLDATWFGDGFDDSAWPSGTLGAGYDNATAYDPLIDQAFDFSNQVSSNADETVYMRIPFDVDDPLLYDTLTLGVRYDDGFVAYLNGKEIARANAGGNPGTPLTYNARASASHPDSQAMSFQSFPVSQHLDLLASGNNLLAIHGLNASAGSSDMLLDATLVASEGIGGNAGGLSPGARNYSIPINLPNPETTISARVFSGTQWSPLTRASFLVDTEPAGAANLVISKIHYRPSAPSEEEISAGHNNRNDFEYVELMNIGDKTISLEGVRFVSGIDFKFDNGISRILAPGARGLLVENPAAFDFRFGSNLPVLGKFENDTNLANGGERLALLDAQENPVRDFYYDDSAPWPTTPDGDGFALTLVNPLSNPDHSQAGSWQASASIGGNPGFNDTVSFSNWQALNFTEEELANPAVSSAGADPDNDGMTNLEEFLFGGNPIAASKDIIPLQARIEKLDLGNGLRDFAVLEVTINRAAAQSVDWQLLTSRDGATWTDADPLVELMEQSEMGEGMERRRYRILSTLPDNTVRTRLFIIESRIEN
ncbi:MAG: chitobiase/beta-hexosaminidase C-terminal domain-containing protein, partial [Verrucomicrobiota bacterium]|nr:chitobiase/beta-hexosaminidase C-terminal domain-containing protein [Verrucomicrobiota bacterium]